MHSSRFTLRLLQRYCSRMHRAPNITRSFRSSEILLKISTCQFGFAVNSYNNNLSTSNNISDRQIKAIIAKPASHLERRVHASGRWLASSTAGSISHSYCTDTIPPPPVEGETKVYPQKIQNLVDEISKLTLIEVADLNELLKKTLNITDTPMMAMGAMPAMSAPKEDEETPSEKKPEKVAFTVKLAGFDEAKKVALIKQIKNVMAGMNLVQAKKFVESTPQTVKAEVTKQEADELKKALEEVGGKVEVE